jgi:gluconate 5-dehydrogenase
LAADLAEIGEVIRLEDYRSLFDLTGNVALIVGGAGGLGKDMAWALAQHGADVAIAQRHPQQGEDLKQAVEGLGRICRLYKADICVENDVKGLFDQIAADFGRLDILVNAAGQNILQKAEEYSEENWDKVVDLNLKGTYLTCREAARLMIPQRKGKIINLSSVSGHVGKPEGYLAYCASKGGVNMLTKCLAAEWAKYNIAVNAISPTFIRTNINAKQLEDAQFHSKLIARIPMGRIGVQRDIIGPTLLFASGAADFITGQIILVDGGITSTQ